MLLIETIIIVSLIFSLIKKELLENNGSLVNSSYTAMKTP